VSYLLGFLNLAALYAVLAVSLNLICGYAGMLSVAHAAFFGVGAYTAAILQTKAGFGFPAALAAGALASALTGAAVALPAVRLRGDYLLMATLGFGEIFRGVVVNWPHLTGGQIGLRRIPSPSLLGLEVSGEAGFLFLSVGLLVGSCVLVHLLVHSPFGEVLISISEEEDAAAALGRSPVRHKVLAMAIGAGMAGAAGTVYAGYTSYISPNSFTLAASILVLAMVLMGGAGSIVGPVLGALFLMALPEALRFAGVPPAQAGAWRQLFYGLSLVALMALRPRGLLGRATLEVTRGQSR
jgi:branched-chain amino acid transport system permease protein